MKKNRLYYLLFILFSLPVFSQSYNIKLDSLNTLKIYTDSVFLRFQLNNDNYEYGKFEINKLSSSREIFLIQNGSNFEISKNLVVKDSLALIPLIDWNDRVYVFPFVKINKKWSPLIIKDGKIVELLISKLNRLFFNKEYEVLIDVEKEILEYNYKNCIKNYLLVKIYSFENFDNIKDCNIIKIESNDNGFYETLYEDNPLSKVKSVYLKIFEFLNFCK
jgi:hypothetical protein